MMPWRVLTLAAPLVLFDSCYYHYCYYHYCYYHYCYYHYCYYHYCYYHYCYYFYSLQKFLTHNRSFLLSKAYLIDSLFIYYTLHCDIFCYFVVVFDLQIKRYCRNDQRKGIFIFPIVLQPKSRGRITLNSADPFDRPSIDLNVLGDDEDRKVMKAGRQRYL